MSASAPATAAGYDWVGLRQRMLPNGVVFMSSMCLMIIEMVAGRLVSRNIGSSIYSWTSVIGVIFAGMSIGNYIGGRLAARWKPGTILGQLFLLASFLTLSLIWLTSALGAVSDTDNWPQPNRSFAYRLELGEASLAELKDADVPADVIESLRKVSGTRFTNEKDLTDKLSSLSVPAQFTDLILRTARPVGQTFRLLREAAVSDAAIDAIRPVWGKEFTPSKEQVDKLRAEVRTLLRESLSFKSEMQFVHAATKKADPDYEPDAEAHFNDQVKKTTRLVMMHSREESIYSFPLRLMVMVAFVFLAPAIMLGLISPVVAQMAIDASKNTGRAVGNVYAWGAWGSIIGTFLAGFYLISAYTCFRSLAVCALILAVLGVVVATPRLLQSVWLLLLAVLVSPLFEQGRLATAADRNPGDVKKRLEDGPAYVRAWHNFALMVGKLIHLTDTDLSEDTLESDYQFIKVSLRSSDRSDGTKDMRVLALDHLIHGYVVTKMPDGSRGDKFNWENSVFDPEQLHYNYEKVYAVAAARAVKDRFAVTRPPTGPAQVTTPKIKTLFIGGGSYTFQRYIVETYPGEKYVVKAGDSWNSIIAREYGLTDESALKDLEARVIDHNKRLKKPTRLDAGDDVILPSISDVAELDPEVTRVNVTRLKLDLGDSRIRTWNYDARNFVEAAAARGWKGKYDVIFGDAFNHYSVPYHLTTKEFNDKIADLLAPGGVYIVNIIDKYETCRFMSAYVNTLRQSFGDVQVVGDSRPKSRSGRETFVVTASKTPLAMEFLGGPSDEVIDAVGKRDIAKLEKVLKNDPGGLESIKARFQAGETPDALVKHLGLLKRIDRKVLWSADAEDSPVDIRSVAFGKQETEDTVLEPGRPPNFNGAFRNTGLVRAVFGPPAAEYEITKDSVKRLVSAKRIDAAFAEKLTPLVGIRFESVEAFGDALAKDLPRADVRAYKSALIKECRSRDQGKGELLVLTDSRAPVDELLSPLFEDDYSDEDDD